MEEFTKILNLILGSERSGVDLAALILGISIALLFVTGRKTIIESLVKLIEGKVIAWEQSARNCAILAQTLVDIRNGMQTSVGAIESEIVENRRLLNENSEAIKNLAKVVTANGVRITAVEDRRE